MPEIKSFFTVEFKWVNPGPISPWHILENPVDFVTTKQKFLSIETACLSKLARGTTTATFIFYPLSGDPVRFTASLK